MKSDAPPATPGAGRVSLYAKTDNRIYAKDETGAEVALSVVSASKTITIESPNSAEDVSFFFTDAQLNVRKMSAVLVGSGGQSVTWTIRHGADRSAIGTEIVTGGTVTTDTTTGSDVTVLDNEVIAANSHVWLETTALAGTVNSITITLFF